MIEYLLIGGGHVLLYKYFVLFSFGSWMVSEGFFI